MKLYLKNIDVNVNESDLIELFSHCGEVKSIKIIREGTSRSGNGFGFVEMINARGALLAIRELDGKLLMSKTLSISRAKSRSSK